MGLTEDGTQKGSRGARREEEEDVSCGRLQVLLKTALFFAFQISLMPRIGVLEFL